MSTNNWERRWQPLLEEWVIISANTGVRPWSGAEFKGGSANSARQDPTCYLCPESKRSNDALNPDYQGAWAFDNDFPSLSFSAPERSQEATPLHRTAPAHGLCRVLCWHPRHDLTLASLSSVDMMNVVTLLKDEFSTIRNKAGVQHILMFENKGTEIGVSNPHPHGQIYASTFVPKQIDTMRRAQHQYFIETKKKLIIDLISAPQHLSLIVYENDSFTAAVPFAARFPYESWIVPKRSVATISELNDQELKDLGEIWQNMARRYNNLFQREAPNITLIQNAPVDENPENDSWQFHIIFQPPLRDQTKLKYLAGYESGTNCIVNPVQPELAAESLRNAESIEGERT